VAKHLFLGAATAAILAAGASPAQAHDVTIHEGRDTAHADEDHHSGWVSDRERDGHVVKAVFRRGDRTATIFDRNGPSNGKVRESWAFTALEFRLCEVRPGPDDCTRWREI
jgi:hypothetical protein